MTNISESLSLVLLADSSADMVCDAVAAVADALPDPAKMLATFQQRRLDSKNGLLPPVLRLLCDDLGPVGWVGWAAYKERPNAWQTTTYFSSSNRGTGLLERARCWQLHAGGVVGEWHATHNLTSPLLVSSIAAWNERSLRASRRFAAENEWPDTWERVFESAAQREAFVFTFPGPDAPHHCFLQHNTASLVQVRV